MGPSGCGGGMLQQMLNQHWDIACLDEEWEPHPNRQAGADPALYLREAASSSDIGPASVVGFQCPGNQASIDALEAHEDLMVILLRRQNLLQQLSWQIIADASDGRRPKPPADKEITITLRASPDWLRRRFVELEQTHERIAHRLRDHPMLQVSYERLIAAPREWRRVMEFLRVEPSEWRPPTHEPKCRSVRVIFPNFSQIQEAFAGTRFAWVFDEQNMAEACETG